MGFGVDPSLPRERMAANLTGPGWVDLPAVENGGVHAIYHGGSRTLSDYTSAQYIAKQLYPAAFADVDPAANLRAYYEEWLPIRANGVFFLPYEVITQ